MCFDIGINKVCKNQYFLLSGMGGRGGDEPMNCNRGDVGGDPVWGLVDISHCDPSIGVTSVGLLKLQGLHEEALPSSLFRQNITRIEITKVHTIWTAKVP